MLQPEVEVGDTDGQLLQVGYWLSCEEHDPKTLVCNAARAEEAGFGLAGISDHFHPWVPEQGHSPFVWSVLGGIAGATEELRIGTGVTARIIRMHPAIVAQAAATAAVMLDGRFCLGVGTGERLNEHITGVHWPRPDVRRDMLEEAVDVIRQLWDGEPVDHRGAHYTVEQEVERLEVARCATCGATATTAAAAVLGMKRTGGRVLEG